MDTQYLNSKGVDIDAFAVTYKTPLLAGRGQNLSLADKFRGGRQTTSTKKPHAPSPRHLERNEMSATNQMQ
jgi:hypothetical protein